MTQLSLQFNDSALSTTFEYPMDSFGSYDEPPPPPTPETNGKQPNSNASSSSSLQSKFLTGKQTLVDNFFILSFSNNFCFHYNQAPATSPPTSRRRWPTRAWTFSWASSHLPFLEQLLPPPPALQAVRHWKVCPTLLTSITLCRPARRTPSPSPSRAPPRTCSSDGHQQFFS